MIEEFDSLNAKQAERITKSFGEKNRRPVPPASCSRRSAMVPAARHDRLDRARDVGVETRLPPASQVATLDHERNARCPRW